MQGAALCAAIAALAMAAPMAIAEEPPAGLDPAAALGSDPDEVLASVSAKTAALSGLRPKAGGLRVALISTGVDARVLPESLRDQVTTTATAVADPVGYGTYSASALLQLTPDARITSFNVFPYGRLESSWLVGTLEWLRNHESEFDVVLFGAPPNHFADPISVYMAAGTWERASDRIADVRHQGAKGPVFGAPLWSSVRHPAAFGLGTSDWNLYEQFATLTSRWAYSRWLIQRMEEKGLAFVTPAGDLGPGPQTAFGLANLREAITVGGFDGAGVSPTSGSGPSIDGRVKPDLIAPTGLVGLMPDGSPLARYLATKKLIDSQLEPAWDAGLPATNARARLDSTLSSAVVVAAAVAGLAAEGVRDVDRQRGALTAASVPLDGVPVWRQGAGVLRRTPDRAFADSRPLALGHADFGAPPRTGGRSAKVVFAGGAPASASPALSDFEGVSPDGRAVERDVAPDAGPPVGAQVTGDAVELTAPAADGSRQAGLYCGYTEVAVPGTGGSVPAPSAEASGIPEGTEQVPTCLIEPVSFRARGFYIHDIDAEDLTFALFPSLPPGATILEHPLTMLPIDPLDAMVYADVTGTDGMADFPNILPGYYRVKLFSDYGAPIEQTVRDSVSGADVAQKSDIGEPAGYQALSMLIPSTVCSKTVTDAVQDADAPDPCGEQTLKDRFGEENVEYDRTTLTWVVTLPGGERLRVAFNRMKKMPGTGIASRYIDLLRQSDFRFWEANVGTTIRPAEVVDAARATEAWSFTSVTGDPTKLAVVPGPSALDREAGVAASAGIAEYPFNLTTPNYKAHMSFNFSYDVTNALIVAAVVTGESVAWGVVTPDGTVQLPRVNGQSLDLSKYAVYGHATGKASFDWRLLPKGAREGKLYLVFVPSAVNGLDTKLSSATVGDLSFELDTWNNESWPPTTLDGGVTGHSFAFDSRYSERQMSHPECRAIDSGGKRAEVCEDWQVLVHSPGDHAATVDMRDLEAAGTPSMVDDVRTAGGRFFDPRRGRNVFSHVLAFNTSSPAGVEPTQRELRTNGRFWEQLAFPKDALRKHPGRVRVLIQDYLPGRSSGLLPHSDGGARVAPYVPFKVEKAFLKP